MAQQIAGSTEVQEPLDSSEKPTGNPRSVKPSSAKNRVLIIVENQAVPLDPRVWREACSLSDNGYEVTVLCPRRKGCSRGYEVIDRVHIYRHPMPVEGSTPLGYLSEYACAFVLEFLYTLWIYFRRGFDVIQGCNPPDNIFLVALPFKFLGVKYIFDHHDANPELYRLEIWKEGPALQDLGRAWRSYAIGTVTLSWPRTRATETWQSAEGVFVRRAYLSSGTDPICSPSNPFHRILSESMGSATWSDMSAT